MTDVEKSDDSRLANTEPAEPAPTMTTSRCSTVEPDLGKSLPIFEPADAAADSSREANELT
ncbi:hypothetical protein HMPREF1861_01439 [Corynebacterium kroppenstedtii]|nr:hypothetical protein HMPREF1861_01439 [Corynebacterium kroppenstedtii]